MHNKNFKKAANICSHMGALHKSSLPLMFVNKLQHMSVVLESGQEATTLFLSREYCNKHTYKVNYHSNNWNEVTHTGCVRQGAHTRACVIGWGFRESLWDSWCFSYTWMGKKKSHADMNRCHLSPVESCETRVIITISSLELENLRPRELDHTSE